MNILVVCSLFLSVFSLFVAYKTNTEPVLLSLFICLMICCFSYRKNSLYKKICSFSYLFYSFWGLLAYFLYYLFCYNTFAPYHDDSFYFLNISNILDNGIDDDATIYEYFMALCSLPLKLIFGKVIHVQLLPINWLLGALVVTESIKFSQKVVPTLNIKTIRVGVLFILLNVSFLDGVVHLYRDILMLYLFIKSINYIYKNSFYKATLTSIFTGFVRGANGLLLFLYMFMRKIFLSTYLRKRKILYMSLAIGLLLFVSLNHLLDYNSLRSFSSSSDVSSVTIAERMDNFKNSEGTGGVLNLLRSSNPFLNVLAVPIYAISPLKVRNFFIQENYLVRDARSIYILRPRLESLWELFFISFYSFYLFQLFVGLYYWYKDSNFENSILLILFLIILTSVTFVSMQTRHKMAFIIFYPIIYNYYTICKSCKINSYRSRFTALFILVIILYNIL